MSRRAIFIGLAVLFVLSSAVQADDRWRGGYGLVDGGSAYAIELAENILSWQLPHGGWSKGIAFQDGPWQPGMPKSVQVNAGVELGSFDDGKTISEMEVLAVVYRGTGDERFKEGFLRGLDYIFDAQYPSGGWPQAYPERGGYSDHVTFNDDAMINILNFVRAVASGVGFDFVGPEYQERAQAAVDRGVDFILRSQIEVDGVLTAWCQQHDPYTYEPTHGRSYELPSITAGESVGIVQFLMSLPDPDPRVDRAILSALEWFERVRLPDGRWARFYEIGTNRPMFVPRSGEILYDYEELPLDARNYAWYGTWPASVLSTARANGLMEALHARLPDHPTPLITAGAFFRAGRPRLAGTVEIPIEVRANQPDALQRVFVDVGGLRLYDGPQPPGPGQVVLDTLALDDGYHALTVTVVHESLGVFERQFQFEARNAWRIVETMKPPEDAGWFGRIEWLQAVDKSEGWEYRTDEPEAFFGDPERLTAVSTRGEHLVWETPNLRSFEFHAYSPAVSVADRLEILVSADGDAWEPLAFEERSVEGDGPWRRFVVQGELDSGDAQWLKLVLHPSDAPFDVQIGHAEFSGMVK